MQLRPHAFKIDTHTSRLHRHSGNVVAWCPDCGIEVTTQYGHYGNYGGVDTTDQDIQVLLQQEAGALCCGSPERRAEYEMSGQKFEETKADIQEILDTQVAARHLYNDLTFVHDTDYIKFGGLS